MAEQKTIIVEGQEEADEIDEQEEFTEDDIFETFFDMIATRDDAYYEITDYILSFINDNVLEALRLVLELPEENISWKDATVDHDDNNEIFLYVTLEMKYFYDQTNDLIKACFGFNPDKSKENVKVITYVFPIRCIASPLEFNIEWINLQSQKLSRSNYNRTEKQLEVPEAWHHAVMSDQVH